MVGPFAIGLDPYYQTAYAIGPQGVDLLRLDDGEIIRRERPAELGDRAVTAAQRMPNDVLALGTDDGHLLLAQVRFQLDYSSGQRQVVPQFTARLRRCCSTVAFASCWWERTGDRCTSGG